MAGVIADASPLIALHQIGQISLPSGGGDALKVRLRKLRHRQKCLCHINPALGTISC